MQKSLQICENVQRKKSKKIFETCGSVRKSFSNEGYKKRRQDSLKNKQNKERGRSFHEENYSFFKTLRIKGKTFSKENNKTLEKLFEHGGKK